MDLTVNSMLANASVQPQKNNAKNDVSFVRPVSSDEGNNAHAATPGNPAETKPVEKSPPVSVVSALVSSAAILNEQPISAIDGVRRREGDERTTQGTAITPPQEQTTNGDDTARQVVVDISSRQSQDKTSDDIKSAQSQQSYDQYSAVDTKRGVNAYQAAGAAFGIGLTENSSANGPTVFSPQNVIPVDIKV